MKVSARGDYLLRILIDLAINAGGRPISLSGIAERQGIPKQFVHRILLEVKAAGMVNSRSGHGGGYFLAISSADVTAAQILRVAEGDLLSFPPPRNAGGGVDVVLRELWVATRALLAEELGAITLADLVGRAREKIGTTDYVI